MTKLSEKLANLGQTEPGRLGFGPRQSRQKTPAILLVGISADGSSDAAKLVDVLLAPQGGDGHPASTSPGSDKTWGAALSTASSDEIDALKQAGAAYIVLESLDAPALVLRDDEMDRGLAVKGEISEDRARALDDSKFEFLVYDGTGLSWPLTVEGVLRLQEQVSLVSKHIFLRVDDLPTADDLAPLRDLPISAIVLDLDTVDSGRLKELHEQIAALEPRKPRDGSLALLPNSRGNGNSGRGEGDYDDDDDWDDDDEF